MIVHYRLEDTFIQGVMTTYVFAHHPCDGIIIIDDELLKDDSLRKIIKSSVPPKIKLYFFGIKNSLSQLKKAESSLLNYYVILRNPLTAYSLLQNGYQYKSPLVCGLQAVRNNTLSVMKGVAFTEEEAEAVELLVDSGVKVVFDPSGKNKNIPWEKLRKNFQSQKERDNSSSGNKNTSLQKSLTIMDCFLNDVQAKLTLSEIQQQTQIPFSTCYRLTVFMLENGYLAKDENTAEYSIGWKLIKFAHNFSDASYRSIIKDISPYYLNLLLNKYNETVSIFTRIGIKQLCLACVSSSQSIIVRHIPDEIVDLHWDAPGLLLLTSTNNIENLEWNLDITELKRKIEDINNNGYAITATGEFNEITSIATPIYGPYRKLLGALTLQAPSFRISPKLSEKILTDLKQVSLNISNEILLAQKF